MKIRNIKARAAHTLVSDHLVKELGADALWLTILAEWSEHRLAELQTTPDGKTWIKVPYIRFGELGVKDRERGEILLRLAKKGWIEKAVLSYSAGSAMFYRIEVGAA